MADWYEPLLDKLRSGKSLYSITDPDKRDDGMPGRKTVYQHIERDEEFRKAYNEARRLGVHALAEQCLEIADEDPRDAVHVADKKIRIDARLRLAGKWLPREYGDKLELTGDPERPVAVTMIELVGVRASDEG